MKNFYKDIWVVSRKAAGVKPSQCWMMINKSDE